MIVYTCKITGDEFLSDSFPLVEVADAEGNNIDGLMMTNSKMVPKSADDVDIGCGNAFGGDGGDDAPAADVEMVNNVCEKFGYTQTDLTAPQFKSYLKEYMGALLEKMKTKNAPVEEKKAFRERAANAGKYFLSNFKELDFYLGPSFSPESMIVAMYPEGALAPNFYFIMDGLNKDKF